MTRYFIFIICFLLFSAARPVAAGIKEYTSPATPVVTEQNSGKPVKKSMESPLKAAPVHQGAKQPAPGGKAHAPTMDETPHIHRFHKERVKKIRRGLTLLWLLSKLLLILCHIGLLVIGYLHATH